ncbi:MAG: hypothetical protein ACFCVE_11135 [Phycisphaerae bacterium]
MPLPKKLEDRLTGYLKTFRPVLQQQHIRDVYVGDTVTLVKDLLCLAFDSVLNAEDK